MSKKAGEAYVELFVKGKKAVASELTGIEKRMTQFGNFAKQIGAMATRAVAGAAAIGGAAVGAGLVASIKKASDMVETMNKFNVVFGESAEEVKKWSDETAAAFGRSKKQVADFMASTQDLLVPMGMLPGEALDTSKALTALAMDLASFNNMADDKVLEDLHAALTGSGEVMKKYGVIVNEAAVKQELLNEGLDKSTATEAQKAMARYNIILRGTTAAQGDVARSADSWANQLKAAQAQLDDMLVVVGTKLLPVLTEWLNTGMALVNVLFETGNGAGHATNNLDEFTGAASDSVGALTGLIRVLDSVAVGFYAIRSQILLVFELWAELATAVASNPLTDLIPGGGEIKNLETYATALRDSIKAVRERDKQGLKGSLNRALGDDLGNRIRAEKERMKALSKQAKFDFKEIDLSNRKASEVFEGSATRFEQSLSDAAERASHSMDSGAATINAAANKIVEVASPDSLESNSLEAYRQFQENRNRQTDMTLNKILAQLKKAPIAVGAV